MRAATLSAAVITAALLVPAAPTAQQKDDPDRKVAGGGITAPGWLGQIDPAAAKKGATIEDSKFAAEGEALHLTIGPAAVYWHPENTASGDYTVTATFREPKPSAGHPHPYGIFIGGKNLGTDQRSLMYCVAYSDGTFLVRGFNGSTVTTVSKRQPHEAVKKATDQGATNEVGWRVQGDRAECLINGTAVASFTRADLVGPDKLESLHGIYGIRVSHNVDVIVTGLKRQ